jgi:membrane-bound lytic murein transglycosylase B
MANAVSDTRIERGAEILRDYKPLLDAIEAKYGVDRHVVVAIWGMETRYGEYMGKYNVIQALATLGYRGNRQRFGRSQLLGALQILERGDVAPQDMMGSWAGAMGHTQFIPTTYNAYAVDFTGDGKRDIWTTTADALASTANYLRVSKWRTGETWGYEVELPSGFNYRLANNKTTKTLAQWQSLGVKRVRGLEFPRPSDHARLYAPAGAKGPAFLTLNNFRSILRYNVAPAYALAVGHLSDRIRGYPPFEQSWPTDAVPLQEAERFELQRLLTARGYAIGDIDGVIGSKTEAAVRDYQRAKGLPVDGFPSVKLLERLRQES